MRDLKEFLLDAFNSGVDGIMFFPSEKDETETEIKGFTFEKKSKYIKGELGNYYHILVYKLDDEWNIIHHDNFEAVLTAPEVYIDHIIRSGFYGSVIKKTKKSNPFFKKMYKLLLDSIYEQD